MAGRRFLYLAALAFCLIFYCLFRQWLTWVLALGLLWLPVLSLLLSLPALLLTRLSLDIPGTGTPGESVPLSMRNLCKLPCTPFTTRYHLRELHTGIRVPLKKGTLWTPAHCGAWEIRTRKCRLFDYMGLISIPAGRKLSATCYIEPLPVPMENIHLEASVSPRFWKPKSGGGFGENHDLRLYRPGDSLQHIHWKMSAKTGKLIYREPMEPGDAPPAILLTLPCDPNARDLALGQLLWLSRQLLNRQTEHSLHCLTGSGSRSCYIRNHRDLTGELHRLLATPGTPAGVSPEAPAQTRCFRIGGDRDAQ